TYASPCTTTYALSLHDALPIWGMLGGRHFRMMRDGATFINTARGGLVDEAAMVAELETGRIQGIIDVTEPEIPEASSPLYSLHRSEEHTSELQSRENIVCRLLL